MPLGLYDLLGAEGKDDQKGRAQGVAVGVVTDNQDPEGMGRVKVRFPWKDDADESTWARVVTPMAGKGRGLWFLPEVGDEVLVAFDHGDVQHPYVLGSLWNGTDTPPGDNGDGNNNIRKITSRSGHELVFDDTSGAEKVVIRTKAGHAITLDDAGGGEKIEIKDKSGSNKLVIDSAQNSIGIESSMKLTIKGQMVEIQSDANMTLKAGAVMTIQGSMVKIN